MGYISDFSIRLIDAPERVDEIVETLQEIIGFKAYRLDDAAFVSAKWYDSEDDLRALSRSFPDCVLELERVGEEYPDIVRQRFRNGAAGPSVKAQITFPGLRDPD